MFRKRTSEPGLTIRRIEAFSDGVLAIAITLLVLEIAVPELTHAEVEHGALLERLIELWPKFLAFAFSFAVISIYWVGHTIMFHFVTKSDRMLLWLNSLFLLSVAFIPFAAAIIGEYAPDKIAVTLYGATLFVASVLLYVIWAYASKHKRLLSPNTSDRIVCLGKHALRIGPIIYAVATLLALVNPYISIAIYILIPIAYIFPSPIDEIVEAAKAE